jgi:hypothetical protein
MPQCGGVWKGLLSCVRREIEVPSSQMGFMQCVPDSRCHLAMFGWLAARSVGEGK